MKKIKNFKKVQIGAKLEGWQVGIGTNFVHQSLIYVYNY